MTEIEERKEKLFKLGAKEEDIISLLEYTENRFLPREHNDIDDDFLEQWTPIMEVQEADGADRAINMNLTSFLNQIAFKSPETLCIELYKSIGGVIPVITTENTDDFEDMVRCIIHKGKEVSNIAEMGASFAFGKTNRFIILSNKPYSNVSSNRMGLDEMVWRNKSMLIRKNHECAHYFTKRYFGSSRNNLHDELIADFNGLYLAFGEYRAEWFLKFLGLSEDSDGVHGRIKVYTEGLSDTAASVIRKLAVYAAHGVENWTGDDRFNRLNETERIKYLCEKDLLSYASFE